MKLLVSVSLMTITHILLLHKCIFNKCNGTLKVAEKMENKEWDVISREYIEQFGSR